MRGPSYDQLASSASDQFSRGYAVRADHWQCTVQRIEPVIGWSDWELGQWNSKLSLKYAVLDFNN